MIRIKRSKSGILTMHYITEGCGIRVFAWGTNQRMLMDNLANEMKIGFINDHKCFILLFNQLFIHR